MEPPAEDGVAGKMGKIRVVEGVIQEVSQSIVSNDGQHYGFPFVKIAGERIRDLNCGDLIYSTIKPGSMLRISIIDGWTSKRIAAVQLPDGEILKEELLTSVSHFINTWFLWALIIGCIAFPVFSRNSLVVPFLLTIASVTILTFLLQRYRFKGRKALDRLSPPKLQTAQSS